MEKQANELKNTIIKKLGIKSINDFARGFVEDYNEIDEKIKEIQKDNPVLKWYEICEIESQELIKQFNDLREGKNLNTGGKYVTSRGELPRLANAYKVYAERRAEISPEIANVNPEGAKIVWEEMNEKRLAYNNLGLFKKIKARKKNPNEYPNALNYFELKIYEETLKEIGFFDNQISATKFDNSFLKTNQKSDIYQYNRLKEIWNKNN